MYKLYVFDKVFNPMIDLGAELIFIVAIIIFLYFISKILSNFRIGSRNIRIPRVITIIFASFLLGVIFRLISPTFSFELTPYLSTISIIILFISFGAMIDFRSLKKIGIWVLLMGTIPYLIEVIGLTAIVTLLTKLQWFESAIVGTLIATCSVGITSPRLIESLSQGYESKTQLNETLSLASAVESILSLVFFVMFIIFYKMGYSDSGITGTSSLLVIFVFAPIILIGGVIVGISLGLFALYIVKPMMKKVVPHYKILINGLEGKGLEQANIVNEKAKNKSYLFSWIIIVSILVIIYFALQTIALGFIMMESALVSGMVLSISGSKSLENQEIQKSFAKNSSFFYAIVGSIIVWGFGGILINPSSFVGHSWGNTNSIPNIAYIVLFAIIGAILRFGGIFFIMGFSSRFTLKQKIYSFIAFYTKGTGGVNNGAALLLLLGVTQTSGDQYDNAIIMREMLLGWGAFMVFLTIPIGDILLVKTRGKLIYKWSNLSEGEFKRNISLSSKGIIKKESKELKELTSKYWKLYYSKEKQEISISKKTKKMNMNIERNIKYKEYKINNLSLRNFEIENEIIKYKQSQERTLKYLKESLSNKENKFNIKMEKNKLSVQTYEKKMNNIISKNKDKIKSMNDEINIIRKDIKPKVDLSIKNDNLKVVKYNVFLKEYNKSQNTLSTLITKSVSDISIKEKLLSSIL